MDAYTHGDQNTYVHEGANRDQDPDVHEGANRDQDPHTNQDDTANQCY
jgi:hypothetical protein